MKKWLFIAVLLSTNLSYAFSPCELLAAHLVHLVNLFSKMLEQDKQVQTLRDQNILPLDVYTEWMGNQAGKGYKTANQIHALRNAYFNMDTDCDVNSDRLIREAIQAWNNIEEQLNQIKKP